MFNIFTGERRGHEEKTVDLLPHGTMFTHCGRVLTVVAHSWNNGYDLALDGLLCQYSDESGAIKEIFIPQGPSDEFLQHLYDKYMDGVL